ncbi:MAG: peptidyl-prolyl cis-trans isomerase [Candidatus Zapsychrus exili]|nr:peptidyl-prolyl cis-trans isomerase [Candidatus Zapsychrus exili]
MIKLAKRAKSILIIFISLLLFTSNAFSIEDSIIAIVNDEVITQKDLESYINSTYVNMATEGADKDQIESIMNELSSNGLNKLIEDKLLLSKANGMELTLNEKVIQERIDSIIKKYPSEQDFIKALVSNGSTITDLRNKIADQLKIQYIIKSEIKSKIYVNPKEITTFYEENLDKFKRKERVNIESIYVQFKGPKEDARNKAKEALSLINQGRSFKEVSEEFSDTPSVGVVEKGQFLSEIEDVIFNLSKNEVSEMIEVDTGIFIFKLVGKIPSKVAELKEAKAGIEDLIYQIKMKEKIEELFKELKENAYIEIK